MASTMVVPINIHAASQAELVQVAEAIQTLVHKAGNANLIKLANKVKSNPALVQMAFKYI